MRAPPAKLAFLLMLVCVLPAAAAEAPRCVSLWPLFFYWREPERTAFEALGPLIFYQRGPETTTYGLRPLFSVHREHARRRRVLHILYPLSYFRTEPKSRRHYAFPLYYHQMWLGPKDEPATVTTVFPLFWWGHRPGAGSWFFVLFLGGTAKGFLGIEDLLYGGFFYSRQRTGDYVIHHYLWPLVSIGRGPGRRLLRLWPFYGYAEQEGQWWNGYVLWPFVTYGRRQARQGKSPATFFSLWPFFGRSRALDGSGASYQVLWPLFFYAWGTHKGYREWRAPFPIVVGKRTDDVRTFNLWPLFGQRRYKAGFDTYFLWPLVHYSRFRGKRSRREDLKVFPLFSRVTRSDAKQGTRRSFWLLYPLWRSRSVETAEGRVGDANSLQLAWFADSEGFDRDYNALLGLFEHAEARGGRRATRFLWRLFRFERGPRSRLTQLGPLASWSTADGLTKSSYLLGLVQTGKRDGKRGWRIFFVPFGASLTRPAARNGEGEARGN